MKTLLIIGLVVAAAGIFFLGTSAYLAVAYYFPGENSQAISGSHALDEKLDSDGDGLTDKQEKEIYHTDPHHLDTDRDGYTDKTEIEAGFDPLNPPAKM